MKNFKYYNPNSLAEEHSNLNLVIGPREYGKAHVLDRYKIAQSIKEKQRTSIQSI